MPASSLTGGLWAGCRPGSLQKCRRLYRVRRVSFKIFSPFFVHGAPTLRQTPLDDTTADPAPHVLGSPGARPRSYVLSVKATLSVIAQVRIPGGDTRGGRTSPPTVRARAFTRRTGLRLRTWAGPCRAAGACGASSPLVTSPGIRCRVGPVDSRCLQTTELHLHARPAAPQARCRCLP